MTNIGEDKAGKATSLVGLHRQGAPQGCITFSSVVNRELRYGRCDEPDAIAATTRVNVWQSRSSVVLAGVDTNALPRSAADDGSAMATTETTPRLEGDAALRRSSAANGRWGGLTVTVNTMCCSRM